MDGTYNILDKDNLLLIVDKIMVYDGIDARIDIQLKLDITMLLETGTLTEEELEEAGYRGKVINFNWDIEGNLSATIVQKVRNLKDKAFSVNVICGGDPFRMCTVAYKIVVAPRRICTENKMIVINQKVPHIIYS